MFENPRFGRSHCPFANLFVQPANRGTSVAIAAGVPADLVLNISICPCADPG
jgi:hypothetical protein